MGSTPTTWLKVPFNILIRRECTKLVILFKYSAEWHYHCCKKLFSTNKIPRNLGSIYPWDILGQHKALKSVQFALLLIQTATKLGIISMQALLPWCLLVSVDWNIPWLWNLWTVFTLMLPCVSLIPIQELFDLVSLWQVEDSLESQILDDSPLGRGVIKCP